MCIYYGYMHMYTLLCLHYYAYIDENTRLRTYQYTSLHTLNITSIHYHKYSMHYCTFNTTHTAACSPSAFAYLSIWGDQKKSPCESGEIQYACSSSLVLEGLAASGASTCMRKRAKMIVSVRARGCGGC
jgi:hypothetical protein